MGSVFNAFVDPPAHKSHYTNLRRSETMGPLSAADGHDAPRLINELVSGLAALADDVVMRGKDAVVEPIVAHELPDVIDRL